MIVLNVIVVIIAAALWAFLLANLLTLHKNDPAGRGLAVVWAVFTAIALWIVLGGALIVIAIQTEEPWLVLIAQAPAYFLSGLLVLNTIKWFGQRLEFRWMLLPSMILPGCFLASPVSFWISQTGIFVILFFCWREAEKLRAMTPRRAEVDVEWEHRRLEEEIIRRRAKREKFATLTDETPLWVWQDYADVNDEMRSQALFGIRTLPNRQVQAEAMLEKGYGFIMREMPNLGLQPTPALLAAGKQYVANHAVVSRPPAPDPGSYDIAGSRIEYPLAGIGWLVEHGCDLREELAALIDAVKQWGDSRCRGELLGLLDIYLAKTHAAHGKA